MINMRLKIQLRPGLLFNILLWKEVNLNHEKGNAVYCFFFYNLLIVKHGKKAKKKISQSLSLVSLEIF